MRLLAFLCGLCVWGSAIAQADLYQWTDAQGAIHVVDEASEVPDSYRAGLKVYHAAKTVAPLGLLTAPLSPGRTYAAESQGAFAQKLALDLGLIRNSGEDALGPLNGAGIQPAGGWKVNDPLTPEAFYELLAATRRAANSRRLALSADGAEAVVRQAAAAFLPAAPEAQAPLSPPAERYGEEPVYYEEEPEVIIEQAPPQVIEVVPEPYYVPFPVIVGSPHFRHRHRGDQPGLPPTSPTGPFTTHPGLTPMPFGASHLPFGASHLPFGSSHPTGPFLRR